MPRSDVINQPLTDRGPFHHTPWIWPTSALVVNVEPLSHWPGSMCSQPRPLESGFRSVLFLWRTFTNYVTHCERLSRYEISRRSVSLTFGWRGGHCLARYAEHTLRRRLGRNTCVSHPSVCPSICPSVPLG